MIKALAITGPTASGKTALSVELSKKLGCEIISCDSMQIYRGMNIGTAKATEDEQKEAVHHLIDIISPTENYSAESYRSAALSVMEEITKREHVPLFVGGTGLYIDTVMRGGTNASPESDPEYREEILRSVKTEEDKIALWQKLNSIDPISAEKTHYNNLKRVIRALEIYDKTGKPKSEFDEESRKVAKDADILMMTLDVHDRELLYKRVDLRVDIMMKEGLLDEVNGLYKAGVLPEGSTAAQAIGYKELIKYIKGEISLFEAVEEIKLSSRRYAKRQLTWFRHEPEAKRIYIDTESGKLRTKNELVDEALLYSNEFLKTTI